MIPPEHDSAHSPDVRVRAKRAAKEAWQNAAEHSKGRLKVADEAAAAVLMEGGLSREEARDEAVEITGEMVSDLRKLRQKAPKAARTPPARAVRKGGRVKRKAITMKITIDNDAFDEDQLELLCWLTDTIRKSLESAKVSKAKVRAITDELAFAIACIVDGSTVMSHKGKLLVPVLAFAQDEAKEVLLLAEGGSSMHESAIRVTEQIFEGNWKPSPLA